MVKNKLKTYLIAGALLAACVALLVVRTSDERQAVGAPNTAPGLDASPGRSGSAPVASLESWLGRIDVADAAELRRLVAEALSLTDPEMRQAILTRLTSRWMLLNPRDFLSYLTALEIQGGAVELAVLSDALRDSLALLSPDQAGSDDIRLIVQRLVSILVSTDPEGALLWARLWLLDDTLDMALVSITRGFARTDVAKGLALIGEIQSSLRQNQAHAMLAGIWAERDSGAAYAWAAEIANHTVRAMSLNSVLLAMAQTDPALAADALRLHTESINAAYVRERAAELASKGISEADLAADPTAYAEMIEAGAIPSPGSPDVELLAIATKVVGAKLAAEDPLAAVAWAESLPGDYLKLTGISGVMEGWAREAPDKAVDYLLSHYPDNNDLTVSLYKTWAATQPSEAAEGTRLIPDAGRREIALTQVITQWGAKGDAAAAAAYVYKLPDERRTDAVYYALASAINQNAPVEAWKAATNIADQPAQYRALKNALSVIVTRNPTQAATLLNTSNLSAGISARLGELLVAVGQG